MGAPQHNVATWQSIRMLRTRPPAGICTTERAAVFASALEQSEQLMRAAQTVGPAARPLPLFYALSQAGRAIAAARLAGEAWRLAGHGLSEPMGQVPGDLLHRRLGPTEERPKHVAAGRRASFAGVADAVASGVLTREVALGAVWAAIPDLMEPVPQMPDLDPGWLRPLVVFPSPNSDPRAEDAPLADGRPLELLVAGLPLASGAIGVLDSVTVASWIATNYAGASGIAAPWWTNGEQLISMWAPNGQYVPVFCWPEIRQPVSVSRLEELAPEVRYDERMLVPAIASGDHLSRLMLWWALLFGLSMVARYDPELWIAALDVNQSKQAVPIEAALDVALGVLPDLILEALTSSL